MNKKQDKKEVNILNTPDKYGALVEKGLLNEKQRKLTIESVGFDTTTKREIYGIFCTK
jgi:hypothetical protein